ncbi:DUF721 domain-containing protein [Candidatus Bipolaricaulota bacterium]|nr:DUF721 domain-containing protein [Candidatus Bipolaricaulota bacterium]
MNWTEEVLRKCNLWKDYSQQRALLFWEDVVGERIARLTRAERFTAGTLVVNVTSSTVAQELSFFKERYIERINELLGEGILREIRFVPGRFEKTVPRKLGGPSASDREAARATFSQLMDPQLRRSFERLYLALLQREKALLAGGAKRCLRCGVVFRGQGETCPGCRFGGIEDTQRTD